MTKGTTDQRQQVVEQVTDSSDWVAFPGGELEGRRPRALCAACRDRLQRVATGERSVRDRRDGTLCFECYRAELERERRMKAAGGLLTASDARFQCTLPFDAVNTSRLERLRAERAEARRASSVGVGAYADRRRQAQLAARHALQQLGSQLESRRLAARVAELQLPEAWLPFVMAR